MSKVIWLYDRSRVTTDWQCPRKRYWGYHYGGKGVTGSGLHLELYLGTTLHDGLAAIAQNVPIGTIAETAYKQVYEALLDEADPESMEWAKEQGTLIEGILRGFHKSVWPRLINGGKVIAVEQEMVYDHDGMRFMSKPDLIIEDAEGNNWYVEYKSTSFKKDGWINSWDTAVQLHSSIRAAEATLGIKIAGVIVQGLYKGYESYGKQNSPFCYAYRRQGNPPFSRDELSFEYRAGFKKFPVWELAGGVAKWVDDMPSEVLASQFPTTPPIFIKDHLIDSFFKQRATREFEIKMAVEENGLAKVFSPDDILDNVFPQRFDQCVPSFGKPCQFRQLCHGMGSGNPLDHGFEWREPHHITEIEQWNQSAQQNSPNLTPTPDMDSSSTPEIQ